MTIGLKRGTVQVQSYDPEWPVAFAREQAALRAVFGAAPIEHIGSTSVPGLAAKPIIDMLVAVESFDNLPTWRAALQKLGYEYMPERMFADRKFFPKGLRENRTHHLSIVLAGDAQQWAQPLAFRNYLRSHAAERQKYAALKRQLAQEYSGDRAAYTSAKTEIIRSIIKKANP